MGVLDGVTAVVTGGGRGLGRAIALGFAQAGASVCACARTGSELNVTAEQVQQTGGSIEVVQVDLSTEEGCAELVANVRARGRRVNILVNNAAVLDLLSLEELTPAIWDRTLAVNLGAPFC